MKDDVNHDGVVPAEVRPVAGQSHFALIPIINDLLRTRYCCPGSIFMVENVEVIPISKSGRWRTVQLLLGDGQLCIQAILSGQLQRFIDTGEIGVGCYVRADQFEVRTIPTDEDEPDRQEIVYLVMDTLVTIGWNTIYRMMWQRQTRRDIEDIAEEHDLDLEEMNLEYDQSEINRAQMAGPQLEPKRDTDGADDDPEAEAAFADAFAAFEGRKFPLRIAKGTPPTPAKKPAVSLPVALPRDWHDRQTPLKLTTLRGVPRLPYAQNWSCNILAIVASLSPVESSYLPPYRQRVARIADPSTSKQVHLTVFLEPEKFEPQVGSAVLLVGVKNHRFDGGSLKKYASDADRTGGSQWWFENPSDLHWCDVDGIRRWWDEMQQSLKEDKTPETEGG